MVEMQLAQADVLPGPARVRTGPASWTRRAAPGRIDPDADGGTAAGGRAAVAHPEWWIAASLSRRIWRPAELISPWTGQPAGATIAWPGTPAMTPVIPAAVAAGAATRPGWGPFRAAWSGRRGGWRPSSGRAGTGVGLGCSVPRPSPSTASSEASLTGHGCRHRSWSGRQRIQVSASPPRPLSGRPAAERDASWGLAGVHGSRTHRAVPSTPPGCPR